jgi:hypothetical protein
VKVFFLLVFCLGALVRAEDAPNTLSEEERAGGYRLLFDGTRLAFKGVQKSNFLQSGWKIEGGALSLSKTIQQSGKVTGGDVATVESFVDFDFLFEWKIGVSGNSGVLYFVKSSLGSKPTGSEFQLIDDVHHPDGLKGGPIRRSGALYGVLPPSDAKKLNATDWNKGRLLVQGNHVEHWINDEKVLEYEIGSPAFQQAVKASTLKLPMTFGGKVRSPILLLDEGEEVSFRNLKIKVPGAVPAAK